MSQRSFRETVDEELGMVKMSEKMKEAIRQEGRKKSAYRVGFPKLAAASLALFLLCGTTVFAGYYMKNQINVNEETLPALDDLHIVEMNPLETEEDQYGMTELDFTEKEFPAEKLGIRLLESAFAENNPSVGGHIFTDEKDFCIVTMENYIAGEHPVSLEADIVLSEEQLEIGWNKDYLGMYEFVEAYRSEQGFRVNLIQSTNGKEPLPEGAVSEKCAVFAADGIQYTLKGRVSMERMKEIVDSMR